MPRHCSVCRCRSQSAVDNALVEGRSIRDIAERHGLARSSVHRHAKHHLPRSLRLARENRERASAEELDRILEGQKARLVLALSRAIDLELELALPEDMTAAATTSSRQSRHFLINKAWPIALAAQDVARTHARGDPDLGALAEARQLLRELARGSPTASDTSGDTSERV
jgi:transposase-like protein